MTSPFDLTGRTALVTGGNQGLGRAFAFGLAEAGARVAIVGRSAERNARVAAEAADAGHDFVTITADITDGAQVARMTEEAMTALGRDRRARQQRRHVPPPGRVRRPRQ